MNDRRIENRERLKISPKSGRPSVDIKIPDLISTSEITPHPLSKTGRRGRLAKIIEKLSF
jgi:hypothetical protein